MFMEETQTQKKKLSPKALIGIIIAAILLIGGGVAAYIFANVSDKQKYFLAEKNTMEFMTEQIEKRYEPELDWLEQSKEKPVETNYELSAESNMATEDLGMGEMDPSQYINNSTISLKHAADIKNKQMAGKLQADIGGIKVDGVEYYLTAEQFMLGLPFLDELLSVKGKNVGNLLYQLDPTTFTGEENIDFGTFFEGSLSEEDIEYIKKEYGEMIYDQLSDEAFKSEDETIKVHDQSLDTEKITMKLSEKKLKEILKKTVEKLQSDDKLKDLIREQLELQAMGSSALDSDIDQMMKDFDTSLKKAKDGVDDLHMPDGLTSTIWVHDDIIAQRDFSVKLGPDKDQLVTFSMKGTHLLKEEKQQFNLDFGFEDSNNQGKMNVAGDLSWKDEKAKDSIKLTIEDLALSYDGTESLKDGKRDFERTFSLKDPAGESGSIIWSGSSTYKDDKMNADHSFAFAPALDSQHLFSLHAAVDGKTIDSVKIPKDDKAKDLGAMQAEELMQYFETEVGPKFEGWLVKLLSASGNLES